MPPLLSQPSLPFQRAATSRGNRAPVPSWAICASCDLSAYAYTPSGRSPAQLAASWLRFARLTLGPHCVRRLPLSWPRLATLAVSCRGRGFIARPRAQPSGAPAPCIGNPRQSASSRNCAAVAATLPLLAYYPRLAAPEAHRTRRLALRHASSPLPLATTSLGEPNPLGSLIVW